MGATKSGINTDTIYWEEGGLVYPCRCGTIHEGEYAAYDYAHHNCLHEDDLIGLGDDQVICPICGMSWRVVRNE